MMGLLKISLMILVTGLIFLGVFLLIRYAIKNILGKTAESLDFVLAISGMLTAIGFVLFFLWLVASTFSFLFKSILAL